MTVPLSPYTIGIHGDETWEHCLVRTEMRHWKGYPLYPRQVSQGRSAQFESKDHFGLLRQREVAIRLQGPNVCCCDGL